MSRSAQIPAFKQHPFIRGGHAQTIVGRYLPSFVAEPEGNVVEVEVGDGDRVRVEDAIPEGWKPGDPAAVLVHGLAGCSLSPYVVRMAVRLVNKGVRVARMNLRGAGRGFGLARKTYHAGLSGDVRAVCRWLAGEAAGSPIALVGWSLGGNLVLKLAAEHSEDPVTGLDCVVAANAPLDLKLCCEAMLRPDLRIYDQNFVGMLRKNVLRLHERFPDLGPADVSKIRSVYDFDEYYTAPRHGFADAENYYDRSSAGPKLTQVTIPGLVVHAEDDPFIPVESYRKWQFPESLALELIPTGGHLGYISRSRWDGDRRWLDARLSLWLTERWAGAGRDRQGGHHAHHHSL